MVFQFLKSSFTKVKSALSRARSLLGDKIRSFFQGEINEEILEQLELLLYEADFGVKTATELTQKVREMHRKNPEFTATDYLNALKDEMIKILGQFPSQLAPINPADRPQVLLIVGVNGAGKTTSVAKLAHLLSQENRKVLVGAADTFRAAAVEQLTLWAERLKIDIVKGAPGSDPAAVAYDSLQAGKARNSDVVMIDTAGRLHTKTHLMQELEKIKRTCKKLSAEAPHETLLVVDGTTGQNAIEQAKLFHQFIPLTGIILTKLDGTAKGGIVLAIQREIGIPVKFIGTGEGIDDLQPFDPEQFVNNLFD